MKVEKVSENELKITLPENSTITNEEISVEDLYLSLTNYLIKPSEESQQSRDTCILKIL